MTYKGGVPTAATRIEACSEWTATKAFLHSLRTHLQTKCVKLIAGLSFSLCTTAVRDNFLSRKQARAELVSSNNSRKQGPRAAKSWTTALVPEMASEVGFDEHTLLPVRFS